MLMKLIASGHEYYFLSNFNIFDLMIVFLSLVEILATNFLGINLNISIFRSFRLFRILKIIKGGNKLLMVPILLRKSLPLVSWLLLFMLIFMFTFGVIGVQLFGGKFNPTGTRSRFNNIWWSSITIFQMMIGDDWCNTIGYAHK